MAKFKVYISRDCYCGESDALTCEAKSERGATRIAKEYMRRWDLDWQGCKIQKIVRVN